MWTRPEENFWKFQWWSSGEADLEVLDVIVNMPLLVHGLHPQCSHHTWVIEFENSAQIETLNRSLKHYFILIPVFAGSQPLLGSIVLNALQGLRYFISISQFHQLPCNKLRHLIHLSVKSNMSVDIHSVRSPCKVHSACWRRLLPCQWRRSWYRARCTWTKFMLKLFVASLKMALKYSFNKISAGDVIQSAWWSFLSVTSCTFDSDGGQSKARDI